MLANCAGVPSSNNSCKCLKSLREFQTFLAMSASIVSRVISNFITKRSRDVHYDSFCAPGSVGSTSSTAWAKINLSSSHFCRRFLASMFTKKSWNEKLRCDGWTKGSVCSIVPNTFFNYSTSLWNSQSVRKKSHRQITTGEDRRSCWISIAKRHRALSFILGADKVQNEIQTCRHIAKRSH